MTKNIQHDATFNFKKTSTTKFRPPYDSPFNTQRKKSVFFSYGLESVAKLISKTQSFTNAFKYMSSYVKIENAIQPSITLGAIQIFFRNLQGL